MRRSSFCKFVSISTLFAASIGPAVGASANTEEPQASRDLARASSVQTQPPTPVVAVEASSGEYRVGIDDVLDIAILKPEELLASVTVTPDGSISFPYVGTVKVQGQTLNEIQDEITERLADGYMRYPVVSVSLKESRSRKFFVYGEVQKPGGYPIEEHATVLKAISIAGGFSKFGSASRVKVLRPRTDKPGYETLKVNMKAVMDGDSDSDLTIQSGDMVVVSEGMF